MAAFRLFQLPAELLQLTFDFFVVSRDFKRAMRLRLVNRQFKILVDETIFRHHIFHLLARDHPDSDDDDSFDVDYSFAEYQQLSDHGNGPRYKLDYVPLATSVYERSRQDWLNYIYPYLSTCTLKGQPPQSPLGRVLRVAQAVCELDGNSGTEAIRDCVRELIPLAAAQAAGMLGTGGLLLGDGPEPTDEGLQADVRSAAVWLGKTAYIKRLVAEGVRFCQPRDERRRDSDSIFEHPLVVAAIRGDVEMIKTILGALEPLEEEGANNHGLHSLAISNALEYGHREVIEFALESDEASCVCAIIDSCYLIPWTDVYERAKAVVERHGEAMPGGQLRKSVDSGCTDTVRYHLRKTHDKWGLELGRPAPDMLACELHDTLCEAVLARDEPIVRLLLEEAHVELRRGYGDNPLLLSVLKGRIAITRLLLDHGADPNGNEPTGVKPIAIDMSPIVLAVAKERLDIFRLLRERGALLDTPRTGGAAMEAARKYGLTSMVDLLVGEGVEEDARSGRPVGREPSPGSDFGPPSGCRYHLGSDGNVNIRRMEEPEDTDGFLSAEEDEETDESDEEDY